MEKTEISNFQEISKDVKVILNVLNDNTFISPKLITREKFKELNWNFLVENVWEKEVNTKIKPKQYILLLPNDLQKTELGSIFNRIHSTLKNDWNSFWSIFSNCFDWNKEKNNNHIDELELTLQRIICDLMEELRRHPDSTQIKKWIKRAIDFYQKVFPSKSIEQFSNLYQLRTELYKKWASILTEKYKDIKLRLNHLRNLEESEMEHDLDIILNEELDKAIFHEEFDISREQVKYADKFSKKDEQDLIDTTWKQPLFRKTSNWKDIWELIWNLHIWGELDNNGNLVSLQQESMNMEENLDIDNYRLRLDKLRKEWNIDEASRLELEIAQKIMIELSKYIQYKEDTPKSSSSKFMIQTKKAVCMGRSLMGSYFFDKLWILHDWWGVPEHSVLVMTTSNWKQYYIDPTNYRKPIDITWKIIYDKERYWVYWYINSDEIDESIRMIRIWKPEDIIMSGIIDNQRQQHLEEYQEYSEAWIILDNNNPESYYNLSNGYYFTWDFKNAIDTIKKAIELNPLSDIKYYQLAYCYLETWQYTKAKETLYKSIELFWKLSHMSLLMKIDIKTGFLNKDFQDLNWYIRSFDKKAKNFGNVSQEDYATRMSWIILSKVVTSKGSNFIKNSINFESLWITKGEFVSIVNKYYELWNDEKVKKFINII